MFNLVSLQLDGTDAALANLPTDARLAAVRRGGDDPGLVALYFQFGRYLLMSSSRRPARLPANLQGIWSERLWAPWEADYHLNINLQMNYWPAGPANLAETVAPLLDWFELLAKRGDESVRAGHCRLDLSPESRAGDLQRDRPGRRHPRNRSLQIRPASAGFGRSGAHSGPPGRLLSAAGVGADGKFVFNWTTPAS